MALLNRDIDTMASKTAIKAAVVEVLRELGLLPTQPKRRPSLSLVPKNEDDD